MDYHLFIECDQKYKHTQTHIQNARFLIVPLSPCKIFTTCSQRDKISMKVLCLYTNTYRCSTSWNT